MFPLICKGEIHCAHSFYGLPSGTPPTNDLIIRNLYALSSNNETKFADWVAYRLDNVTVTGNLQQSRKFEADPLINASETLELEDYKDIRRVLNMEMAHLALLESFKGVYKFWHEANYLSNVAPMKSDLEQGAWRKLENKVSGLAKAGNTVYVITGTLYERDMPLLPKADEKHIIPSGYWKIIFIPDKAIESIMAAGFVFDQDTPRGDRIIEHIVTINEIEKRSGLDFLGELPDDVEEEIESKVFKDWARKKFN